MLSREGGIVQRELRTLFLQFFTPLGNLFRPYDRVANYHGVRCCPLPIMQNSVSAAVLALSRNEDRTYAGIRHLKCATVSRTMTANRIACVLQSLYIRQPQQVSLLSECV